ncbi:MAG: alkaline phosphatase family protein [Erysipelotrichales bacterium]|nr:alkaline phosphatase family protein [Erysipelotrichales bacterium]
MKLPNYDDSILSISSSILKHYNVPTEYKSMADVDKELKKKYKNVFLVLIDGLGHYNLTSLYDGNDLLRRCEKRPISSVYPSTTVAATTVACSGLPPITTGWVGWHQYFSEFDEDYIMFLDFTYYKKGGKCPRNIEFDVMDYERLWTKVANNGYHGDFIYPPFRTPRAKTFKDQCDMMLEIANDDSKNGFTYVYWDKLDSLMHEFGVLSDEVKNHAKEINQNLEELQKQISDDTLIIVTADHGHVDMEYIDLGEYPDITELFDKAPTLEARAMNFYIKDDQKEKFKELFNKYFSEYFVLYSHEEIFDMHLLGEGKEYPLIHEIIGDFLACAIGPKAFKYIAGGPPKGNHAGMTDEEMTTPLIFIKKEVNKPDTKKLLEQSRNKNKLSAGKNFNKIVGKPKDKSAFRRVNFNG